MDVDQKYDKLSGDFNSLSQAVKEVINRPAAPAPVPVSAAPVPVTAAVASSSKALTGSTGSSSSVSSGSGKVTLGGQTYAVDSKGNVYKNNVFVPAQNLKYVPSSVLSTARQVKAGG